MRLKWVAIRPSDCKGKLHGLFHEFLLAADLAAEFGGLGFVLKAHIHRDSRSVHSRRLQVPTSCRECPSGIQTELVPGIPYDQDMRYETDFPRTPAGEISVFALGQDPVRCDLAGEHETDAD